MSQEHGAYGDADATPTSDTSDREDVPIALAHGSTDETLNARVRRRPSPAARTVRAGAVTAIAAAVVLAVCLVMWLAVGRPGRHGGTVTLHGTRAGTVTVGLRLAPASLDIRNQSGNAVMQLLIGNVYEGLVARDSSNGVVPALADSWERSDDGLTYTFHLADGQTFSNGDALTAQDAVWSLRQLLDHRYYEYEQLGDVASVTAPDERTVVVRLASPNANFLWALASRPGLVFDADARYDPKTEAVGSGPYVVREFLPGDRVVLEANPDYHGRNRARTRRIVVRYFADDNAAVNALTSGDVQVLSPVDATLAEPLRDDPGYVVRDGDGSDKYVLAFNNRRAPFTDRRVRQAFRYAIDHRQIIASRGGIDGPLGGPIPSVDPGYRDLTGLYPHDVDRARSLMRQAGYGPDRPLHVTLTYANTYGTELGDQLRSQLGDIYVDLDIDYVEFSTWLTDVHDNADYDLSLVDHAESHDFGEWADPDYYFGYDSARVRDLYAKAMAATSDRQTDRLLAEAARQVSEDAAADWLFSYRLTTATARGVEGFPADLTQTVLPLWAVTYAPGR